MLDRNRFERDRKTEKNFRQMIELAPDLISICRGGKILSINPTDAKILGRWPIETISTRCGALVGQTISTMGIRLDGDGVPIELSMSVLKIGERTIFIGALRDIIERMSAERRLRESAALDPLLKMPNRRVRDENLQAAIDRADADGSRIAVRGDVSEYG